MKQERHHLLISGVVQGVGFRYHTRAKAKELGLVGWCRNTEDGKVEIIVAGPSEAIQNFLGWCQHGPPSARVDKVENIGVPADAAHSDFVIRKF